MDVNDLNLLGKHNFENVMAACAMSISFGVPMDRIVEVLKVFKACLLYTSIWQSLA